MIRKKANARPARLPMCPASCTFELFLHRSRDGIWNNDAIAAGPTASQERRRAQTSQRSRVPGTSIILRPPCRLPGPPHIARQTSICSRKAHAHSTNLPLILFRSLQSQRVPMSRQKARPPRSQFSSRPGWPQRQPRVCCTGGSMIMGLCIIR